jgi:hypothetical protein
MAIEPFKIENESAADEYLTALFVPDKYRSIDEVNLRAQKYISNERVRAYFVNNAKEMLAQAKAR